MQEVQAVQRVPGSFLSPNSFSPLEGGPNPHVGKQASKNGRNPRWQCPVCKRQGNFNTHSHCHWCGAERSEQPGGKQPGVSQLVTQTGLASASMVGGVPPGRAPWRPPGRADPSADGDAQMQSHMAMEINLETATKQEIEAALRGKRLEAQRAVQAAPTEPGLVEHIKAVYDARIKEMETKLFSMRDPQSLLQSATDRCNTLEKKGNDIKEQIEAFKMKVQELEQQQDENAKLLEEAQLQRTEAAAKVAATANVPSGVQMPPGLDPSAAALIFQLLANPAGQAQMLTFVQACAANLGLAFGPATQAPGVTPGGGGSPGGFAFGTGVMGGGPQHQEQQTGTSSEHPGLTAAAPGEGNGNGESGRNRSRSPHPTDRSQGQAPVRPGACPSTPVGVAANAAAQAPAGMAQEAMKM